MTATRRAEGVVGRDGRVLRALAALLAVIAAFALVIPQIAPVSLVPATRRTAPRHRAATLASAPLGGVSDGRATRAERTAIDRLARAASPAVARTWLVVGATLALAAAAVRRRWSAIRRAALATTSTSTISRFVPARRGPPRSLFL
jgi:hypothetical protein